MPVIMDLESERGRRNRIWEALLARADPDAVSPQLLSAIGLRPHRTVQGIFRDKNHTESIAPPHGLTFSLLFTGRTYDDTFDESGGIYHYPATQRPGRDQAEIEATKNAGRARLLVFVIMAGSTAALRRVRRAWIEDWDDLSRLFLISFAEPHGSAMGPSAVDEAGPFVLRGENGTPVPVSAVARPGQARFRFTVFKRYGPRCAVCSVAVPLLLEAVHLCPFAAGGTDDPRNGLVICRNHHRAFDERLFSFEPGSRRIIYPARGPTAAELAITAEGLNHLPALPHRDAIAWCWDVFHRERGARP